MEVFLYDLRRTTRRGRPALVRGAYGLALLIALGGVFLEWFGPERLISGQLSTPWPELRRADLARFAQQFTAAFLMVQLGAVLLLTPAYAAGAVADERQRRTLDDLLVTELSSGAIVLGKLAARWLHVAAVLLTGLPVLSLMQCWGGVDLRLLLAGFTVTVLASLSLTALSVYCSVREPTVPTAIIVTYLLTGLICTGTSCLPLVCYANPIVVMYELAAGLRFGPGALTLLVVYGLLHLALAVLLAGLAALRLRGSEFGLTAEERPTELPDHGPPAPVFRLFEPPPVGDDPLVWKEQHFGGDRSSGELLRAIGFVLGSAALVIGFGELTSSTHSRAPTVGLGRRSDLAVAGLLSVLGGALAFGAALAAATSISREREQRTLDGLLTLPDGRARVLRAKWLGSLLRVRWLAVGLLALLLGGVLFGRLPPAALLLAPVGAAHVGFIVSLGVYVSVAAGSTARAAFVIVLGLLAVCLLPLLAAVYWDGLSRPMSEKSRAGVSRLLTDGLSPPVAWLRLTSPDNDDRLRSPVVGPVLGAAVYALAGRLLWRQARRRLEREGRSRCGHGWWWFSSPLPALRERGWG